MATFDIVFLLVVGLSALFGFMRGLVVEALGLGAWVVALLALKLFFTPVSAWLRASMESAPLGDIAALLLIVGVTVALVRLAAGFLGKGVQNSVLGPFDRALGGVFGFVRGLVMLSFVYLAFVFLLGRENVPTWIAGSMSFPLVDRSATVLRDFIGAIGEGRLERAELPPGHPPLDDAAGPDRADDEAGDGYSDADRRALEKLFEKNRDKGVGI